jgi:hypothetical protein
MYTNRLNAIPANQDVYIKCEVRVKANGLLQFFGHTVDFDIESPQPFYSIEHTDIIESNKTTHGDSECSKRFSIIAAKKPVKAELILKFRSGCSDTKKPFTIKFRYPVQRLHKKILF